MSDKPRSWRAYRREADGTLILGGIEERDPPLSDDPLDIPAMPLDVPAPGAPTVGEWVEVTPGGERPPAEGYSFLALADGTTFPGGYDPRRSLWCTDHGMHVEPVAYFVPPPYKRKER